MKHAGRPQPWHGIRRGLASLVVLLALTAIAQAEAPARAAPPPPRLFNVLVPQPEPLAALVVGGATTPLTGPWGTLATIYVGEHPEVKVWSLRGAMSTKQGRILVGAATAFLNGTTPAPAGLYVPALGLLQAGEANRCWELINTDVARAIPKEMLRRWIEDGKAIGVGAWEAVAFARVLSMAHYTSAEAFGRAAREDLTYSHLMNESAKYRGQVVHLEGQLRRLRRFDPPPEAAREGVNDHYEAWVLSEQYGPHPICVVFTDLSAGLKLSEKPTEQKVACDAYFYKRYRYEVKGKARETPLLIGHTLIVKGGLPVPADEHAGDWLRELLPVFIGLVAAAVGTVVGLGWWFRRSDRRIKQRILAVRGVDFVDPSANGHAGPPAEGAGQPAPAGEDFTGLNEGR